MKISKEQLTKLIAASGQLDERAKADAALIKLIDAGVIKQVTREIAEMPDRDAMIAELKRRIESGEYNPSGDEIAEAMLRRAVVDSLVFDD